MVLPALSVVFAWAGCAAEISIPGRAAAAGQLVATAATLSTEGAQLSGLQFDLVWDEPLEIQIATGNEIVRSGKLLYTAQLTGRSLRVLIIGMGQGSLANGELVRLFVAVGQGTGSPAVKVSNLIGTTAAGDPVVLRGTSATIPIDGSTSGGAFLQESVLNAASLQPGPVSPGEIITILGAFGINLPSNAAVDVAGTPATILYAQRNQINAVVPAGLDPSLPADLAVAIQNQVVARVPVATAAATPAIFTQNGSGVGLGAILNEDYTPNTPSNPAAVGSIVMMYGTGFGALTPPSGDANSGIAPTTLAVTAEVSGAPADVMYAGAAPGQVAGLTQINVKIPSGVQPGDAVPFTLSAGAFRTPSGVTIAIR